MSDAQGGSDSVFSAEDRLHLLQLMTRRAMSDRRARRDGEERDTATPSGSDAATGRVPDKWQLVPDRVILYEWQKRCLPLWLETGRGTVKVATGGGKTTFALAAAQTLQNDREPDLRLGIVVPTIPLMFQWFEEIRGGNLPDSAIGLMGGGQELPPLSSLRVLICVLNSARDRLPDLVRRADWPRRMLLIVDECHRSGAAQASRIFDAHPRYTLGLSATPEPDLDVGELPSDAAYERGVVGQALGPIIFDFTLKESLDAGLLTPFEVWHVGLPLAAAESAEHARLSREITELRKALQVRHSSSRSKQSFLAWCQTQASRGSTAAVDAERFIGLANRRKRLLYRAASRKGATLGIIQQALLDAESRAIVFHESIEEIEGFFLAALERGLPVALEHSQLPDGLRAESIEAFRTGVARAIISAKSLVEGFNVPSADVGIVAASSSSVRQRIQSLGRMLRRKASGRSARVYVLYVRDTEDEAIYEKADWERVVGAERNRYFTWGAGPESEWPEGLEEAPVAPRLYRPPSWDVDATKLSLGDTYPGQTQGEDLRVDQSESLRLEDGSLVSAPPDLVAAIVAHNPLRRGRVTPAGHLIARADTTTGADPDWRFLGILVLDGSTSPSKAVRLRIRSSSGRRVLAREGAPKSGTILFALGPESGGSQAAGEARDRLLEWIRQEETRLGLPIRELYWDGRAGYWLEARGVQIPYGDSIAPLEFGE